MPTRTTMRRLLTIATSVLIALGLSGCLVGKSEQTKYTGRFISQTTLNGIEAGDSQDEVLSLLGEATTKTEKATGTTIWKYSYTRATTKTGAVFLLFGSSTTTETEGAVYVEFDAENVVVKTWNDN